MAGDAELPVPANAGSLLQSDDRPISHATPRREEAHNLSSLTPSPHLPVIDLAPALAPAATRSGRAEIVSAMLRAAKEWGFFQVVNHGVPVQLLERMMFLARDFFCLPKAQKERGFMAEHSCGYSTFPIGQDMEVEGISLNSFMAEPRAERFANSVWPGGNPVFCETVVEVGEVLGALRGHILQLLAEGMGLPTNFFTRPFEELKATGQANRGAHLRFNYYPASTAADQLPCKAMDHHTDPTLTSLLYQDTGNGLHILDKDDTTWHLVEYKRDGLIFMVGDILQGWSNGVLQAGIHRVVQNCNTSRISLLNGTTTPLDLVLQPATLPMDKDGDSRIAHYKPFTFRELHASLKNGRTGVDEKGRKGIKYIFMTD